MNAGKMLLRGGSSMQPLLVFLPCLREESRRGEGRPGRPPRGFRA
jgi:hypothetical protein